MAPGFGLTVNITWNGTGSTYDQRAYIVAIGYADEVSSFSSGTFAYDYDFSNNLNAVSVSSFDGHSDLGSSGANYADFPVDLMGDEVAPRKEFITSNALDVENLDIFYDTDVRLAKKFLLRGLPTTLIINKDGGEIARVVGSIDFQDKNFKTWLQNFD